MSAQSSDLCSTRRCRGLEDVELEKQGHGADDTVFWTDGLNCGRL